MGMWRQINGRILLSAFQVDQRFWVNREPTMASFWIFLPRLPIHLYRCDCLQIFVTQFGRYLITDNATLNCTRAMGARICVEVNLTIVPIKGFPIVVLPKKCIWQEEWYEKPGFYSTKCYNQGHTDVVCKVGERRHSEGKPKELKKKWQPKIKQITGEVSRTKEGLNLEETTVGSTQKL